MELEVLRQKLIEKCQRIADAPRINPFISAEDREFARTGIVFWRQAPREVLLAFQQAHQLVGGESCEPAN